MTVGGEMGFSGGEHIPQKEAGETLEKKRYQALIVFGFGAKPRTKEQAAADPEGRADSGWHLTAGTKARILAAAELWKMGEIDKLILSEGGSSRNEKTGGQLMKEYLIAKYPEIPEESIVVEDRASNTIENFAGTVDLLEAEGAINDASANNSPKNNIALLSNRFHMARIKEIAERFNISADAFNAEDVLEYAAMMKDATNGGHSCERVVSAEMRMSDEAGNDAYRDQREITRRAYLTLISKVSSDLRAKLRSLEAESEQAMEMRGKIKEADSWVALCWNSEGQERLNHLLAENGITKEYIDQYIEDRTKAIGKVSYGDYLRQENRWMGGMEHIPSYWILQAAKVNPSHFRRMLENPQNHDAVEYIMTLGYKNPLNMDDQEFTEMVGAISQKEFIKEHREMPPEEWEAIDPNYEEES